jgi:hypothetical protein
LKGHRVQFNIQEITRDKVSIKALQIDRLRLDSQNLFSATHRETRIQTHIGANIDPAGRSPKIPKKTLNLIGFLI